MENPIPDMDPAAKMAKDEAVKSSSNASTDKEKVLEIPLAKEPTADANKETERPIKTSEPLNAEIAGGVSQDQAVNMKAEQADGRVSLETLEKAKEIALNAQNKSEVKYLDALSIDPGYSKANEKWIRARDAFDNSLKRKLLITAFNSGLFNSMNKPEDFLDTPEHRNLHSKVEWAQTVFDRSELGKKLLAERQKLEKVYSQALTELRAFQQAAK